MESALEMQIITGVIKQYNLHIRQYHSFFALFVHIHDFSVFISIKN